MAARPKTPAQAGHRFDPAALRGMAGEKVFARGEAYAREGRVDVLSDDGTWLRARVTGSERYRCELRGRGKTITGTCSCPAFTDHGFCKHLVAAGLAGTAAAAGGQPVPDRFQTVRAHLHRLGEARLIKMILDLADRDPALFDRLEIAACAASGDPATLGKRLGAALKRALRTGRFVDYADAGDWARGVLDVLDQLEQMIAAGQGSLVLDLLDDFLPRVDLALNDIDDPNGDGGEILSRVADLHLAACRATQPDPVVLARELFRRETTDPYGTFGGASETYADLLGSKGQAAYRALAEAAWAKLPRPNRRERRLGILQTDDINRGTLFRILDHLLTQYGDVDRRIALRAEDLRDAYDYLNLAQLCLDHGRPGAALRWAEEGAWLHDDPASERLLVFLAARYREADRRDDAEAALWRGFDRRPSAELFAALRALRPTKKARTTLTDQAVKLLEARVEKQKRDHRIVGDSLPDLLVHILIGADRLPSAWQATDRHGCSDQALEALARASEITVPARALDAYTALAERQIGIANKYGYQAACRLITRIGDLRTRLGQTDKQQTGKQQAGKHRAYVDDLLRRHAAKRSFVALLHTAIAKPKTTVIYDSRAR